MCLCVCAGSSIILFNMVALPLVVFLHNFDVMQWLQWVQVLERSKESGERRAEREEMGKGRGERRDERGEESGARDATRRRQKGYG